MKASEGCSWTVWELFHAAGVMVRDAGLTAASEALAQPAVGAVMLQMGGSQSAAGEHHMTSNCRVAG